MSEISSSVSNSEPNSTDNSNETTPLDNSSSSDSEYNEDYLEMEAAAHQHQIHLQERLLSLQALMSNLRNQLQAERNMWKREVEEIRQYYPQYNGYNAPEYEDFYDMNSTTDMRQYEQQMARYQEALAQAQSERRMALQRQIAMSNYKRRLLEIENMCNLELMRVRQSVQWLAPLQQMVSEWNKDNESGDAERKYSFEKTDSESIRDSVNSMEIIGNKLYNTKTSNVYALDLTKASSSSSFLQNRGDYLETASSTSSKVCLNDSFQDSEN